MDTQIATTEKNLPMPAPDSAWGAESIRSEDIRRPFVKILQKENPELLGTKAGDIIKDGTNEVLGGRDKAFEVVLIKHYKEWLLVTSDGAVKSRQLFTDNNLALHEGPATFDGEDVERQLAHVFFALVVGREHEGPMIMSFKKSNKRIAENMLTKIVNNARVGKPIAAVSWMISSQYVTYQKFNWYSYKAIPGKDVSADLVKQAYSYYQELQASQVKLEAALNAQLEGSAESAPF